MKVIPLSVAFLLGLLCSMSMKQTEVVVEEKIVEVPVEVLVPGQNITEYIAIGGDEVEESKPIATSILSRQIDPDSIPQTKPWYIYTGEEVIDHLWSHHQVDSSQVEGWSEEQLNRLHSYLHNGGDKFWEK